MLSVEPGQSALTVEKIRSKQITVGVVGLGYVGYPLSLSFAEVGVSVIGFDIDTVKVESIERGESYIHHIDHGRLQYVKSKSLFRATSEFSKIQACDVVILCVPTPLNAHLDPDLHYITDTCVAFAPHLKKGALVSLESTTWPGTTSEVVAPLLEKGSGFTVGKDLFLSFSPEREDPGNREFQTHQIPKLVGAGDPKSAELADAVYKVAFDQVVLLESTEIAEAAKLFENIYRSVNIALVNEMKVILDKMGIDVWEVIRAAASKPFGFMPFWPGPGLGGHCIPIDPFYLSWKAKEHGITTRFIELAGEINRSMPHFVVGKVQDCLNTFGKAVKGSRILILGLAYKENIDDMRESPSLELIRLLEAKGANVEYHDPYISEIGPTREYGMLEGRTSQPITSEYDCFVLATKHRDFSPDEILSHQVPIVDTRNLMPKGEGVFPA